MLKRILATMLVASAALAGCGGGGTSDEPANVTLTGGQQVTMAAGEIAYAPSGFTVNDHGTITTSNVHHNTAHVKAGAVVTVPPDASGPADNEIIAQ
jgi:hypothetical protein